MYQQIIEADDFRQFRNIVLAFQTGRGSFPPALWARMLYDFLTVYRLWDGNRRRLVDTIVPLYFGRVAAFCRETTSLSNERLKRSSASRQRYSSRKSVIT